ncbi:Heterokaryon incompatibility protein HET [Aspergillus parasiticus SU-1]|uniref:Heterokaryon incompatibility protein HET n=1 Tax=Aspergillus parasiticus (strain ATCC 56775 / NRRL 5862 / SRRC 143 / SU-1) TaxID=1403190 RepID=A0A0F0I6C7_ASPPU|nr:Heterokaryon incompatibility protein HET [Aspergillus parasiticus SU-1]
MPGYEYSPLPTGSSSIRVLLLLPSTDDTASINCQLINYSLPTTGDGYLPYEALSYVWGNNLYAALLHLRDHQLPRMLWVDAVCINQQDEQEKGYQIQLMPTIYGRASHVIVWLGRAADHSDRALDDIRLAAEGSTAQWGKEADSSAILMLLQRPWFRRIWILQEISAARSILVMCGHTKINGITFVLGLTALNLSYEGDADSGLENVIRSITYLMRGAFSRPDYVTQPHGMLSLGELIDMYHTREATKKHDKVYALLGMSSESANKADLLPNYQLSWDILFKRVITSILPEVHSVETWPDREIAVFQGNAWRFPLIIRQRQGAIGLVGVLDGHSKRQQDRFKRAIFAVAHVERQGREMINIKLQKPLQGGGSFLRDILLVWDWEVSQANSGKEDQPQVPKKLKDTVPNSEINLNRNRPHDMALIIEDIMIIAIEAGAHGHRITEVLFEINGLALPISERVVKMVAGNSAWGSEIMWQLVKLFHKRDDNPPISKDVVEVAAGNIGCGDNIIRWLAQALDRKGLILPISEDTVKNVAGNTALGGDIIGYLVHLLDQKGHSLPISEDVITSLINFSLLVTSTLAYSNNCKGSSLSPTLSDYEAALGNIHVRESCANQSQFSVGNCYVIYATNGSGEQRLSGQIIFDTAKSILDNCGGHKGSFGTYNCNVCHVTVNYRSPKEL